MSVLRRIRRNAQRATAHAWEGRIGGVCPRCKNEPLQELEAARPVRLAVCGRCGWKDPKLVRVLVLIRRPDQGEEDEAEGVVVMSDGATNAVRRCVMKGWVTGADRVQPAVISRTAMIPPRWIDRLLTPVELIALGDANRRSLQEEEQSA